MRFDLLLVIFMVVANSMENKEPSRMWDTLAVARPGYVAITLITVNLLE